MTTHIASFRIFPKLSTMIEKAHRDLVSSAFETVIKGVTREVDALIRDLNLVVSEESRETEAEKYVAFACGLRVRLKRAEEEVRGTSKVVDDVRGMYAEGVNRGIEDEGVF